MKSKHKKTKEATEKDLNLKLLNKGEIFLSYFFSSYSKEGKKGILNEEKKKGDGPKGKEKNIKSINLMKCDIMGDNCKESSFHCHTCGTTDKH